MSYTKRISNLVERKRNDAIEFLRKLIKIPSITGNEREIGEAIVEKLREIGLHVEVVEAEKNRPNVIGELRGKANTPALLLNGHMDVVPVGPLEEWKVDPFGAEIEGNRVYGRGATDMKGGLAAMITAIQVIQDLGVKMNGKLLMTAVSDEEMGGDKGTKYLMEKKLIKADMGIVGEATNFFRVDIAHKGICWVRIDTFGKAIHGARPWLGINAVYKMVNVIKALQEFYEKELKSRRDELCGFPTLDVSVIQGGTVWNMVPSRCSIDVNRRLIPGENLDGAVDEIRQILEAMKRGDPEFKYQLRIMKKIPPFKISGQEPIVNILREAIVEIGGKEPLIAGKDAATDATWIWNIGEIPTVVFGPGDYEKASLAANEYLDLDQYVDSIKVYALTISKALC